VVTEVRTANGERDMRGAAVRINQQEAGPITDAVREAGGIPIHARLRRHAQLRR
jgi:hypothetical protein